MNIVPFTIKPQLPQPLERLDTIARNLWISWNFEAIHLFIRLDYEAWMNSRQNPVKMLGQVSPARLQEMAGDDSFLAALDSVYERLQTYLVSPRWYPGPAEIIAYFSMEYGLDVNLPIYSGGLGVLSGDHMKSASDLGLPLVGIGLLYRQGYFQQYLNPDGFQQESYPENDLFNMPLERCRDDRGQFVLIPVEIGGSTVVATVWKVLIGRNTLYLLDTNIDENAPENRAITRALYGGDREQRIRQEILLGVGGIRALRSLGFVPAITHMNEGHSAFLALERIRTFMQDDHLSYAEAFEVTRATTIFTTHTPVAAGNERFDIDLVKKYFSNTAKILGLAWKDFLALGRENPDNPEETFCLTVLALKLSAANNGVSQLHGQVSRRMWKNIWPTLSEKEIPIGHITNGVHPRTWLSNTMTELLDRYFGPRFQEDPTDQDIWERMDRISDEELWRAHDRRRERLVAFVRHRLQQQLARKGVSEAETQAGETLSPYALTIGYARRFAPYKRPNLLLEDPERLIKLLSNSETPVQIVFAGKAHPHDLEGKEKIREIIRFSRDPGLKSRIVFVEDYDLTIARYLVSGTDVWLNTPRRPLEASGTSGMKAAINGSLNISVLDGWWVEAFGPGCGWAIGQGEEYSDPAFQDEVESNALYSLLENEIVPLFYTRGQDGLPREWIKRMKTSMASIGKQFNSQRMLMEYTEQFYLPAIRNGALLRQDGFQAAKDLVGYFDRIRERWSELSVSLPESGGEMIRTAGDKLTVNARVNLAGLNPADVKVELCIGPRSSDDEIETAATIEMNPEGSPEEGCYRYTAEFEGRQTGQQGYTVRILPRHPALVDRFRSGMITWA